jgi:hypothetical protein
MMANYHAADITLNTTLQAEDRRVFQDSRVIQEILATASTIAIVGLSTERTKASNMVASYLQDEGYRVIPIHPKATEILGERAYPSLRDVPEPIDVVNVFRPPAELERIAEDAIAIGAKAFWVQLRLINLVAAEKARAAGLAVVMDKCVKMEHARYGGMLNWAGMNSELITARRRKFLRR